MRPIAQLLWLGLSFSVYVCASETLVSAAKTAELIDMWLRLWIRVGTYSCVLDVVRIFLCEWAIFGGETADP